MKITVSIYERVKRNGKWSTVSVALPRLNKKTGQPFLQDDRRGKFKLSWYEAGVKKFQNVESRCRGEQPLLSEALDQREDKQRYLSNRDIATRKLTNDRFNHVFVRFLPHGEAVVFTGRAPGAKKKNKTSCPGDGTSLQGTAFTQNSGHYLRKSAR